jgi:hypothetical protein
MDIIFWLILIATAAVVIYLTFLAIGVALYIGIAVLRGIGAMLRGYS